MNAPRSERDWLLLSAYLDGELSEQENAALKQRLQTEPGLQEDLRDLRRTRAVLRAAPQRRVPHNFTLTRAMAAETRRSSGWLPALSLSSLLATLALVVTLLGRMLPLTTTANAPMMEAMQAPAAGAEEAASMPSPTAPIIIWGAPYYGGGHGGGGGAGGDGTTFSVPYADGKGGGGDGDTGGMFPEDLTAEPLPMDAAPEAGMAEESADPSAEEPAQEEMTQPLSPTPTPMMEQKDAAPEATPEAPALGEAPQADQSMPTATMQPTPTPPATTTRDLDNSDLILGLPSEEEQGRIFVPESRLSEDLADSAASSADTVAAKSAQPANLVDAAAPYWLAGALALFALATGIAAFTLWRRQRR